MKLPSLARRSALLASAALLTVTLAACGSENDDEAATDPAPSSSTESPDATSSESTESTTESPSETESETGELPAWAPVIETEGDLVTGLDFTDAPAEPSDELLSATVIEGDGPPVEVGQTITANYLGSIYGEAEPFEESYSSQPFQAPIGVSQLIAGWDQVIPGVPVGSRIIMSIPPDLAYGDQGQGPIPGGASLVFVIDIVDAA